MATAAGGKYIDMAQEVCDGTREAFEVDLADAEPEWASRVASNTKRWLEVLFPAAIDGVMMGLEPSRASQAGDRGVREVLMDQRRQNLEREGAADRAADDQNAMPAELMRKYEVVVKPLVAKEGPLAIREVKSRQIGHLVTIRGMVTRCTDVKPLMTVAAYTCEQCGFEVYQPVSNKSFMPLAQCPTPRCATNNTNGRLHLQTRASKLVKFQEIKIQELAGQVPMGHVPRSLTIHAWGSLTRLAKPGNVIDASGVYMPTPFATGFRSGQTQPLIADTFLRATHIHQDKKEYQDYIFDDAMTQRISEFGQNRDTYSMLARSIAPEIFGHEDVKKALLLMLVGGSLTSLKDGVRIRGDLHMCLMGDPGVAKSQLLKHLCKLAPRAVYTTGKGSSGVGLTAAVTKDSVTNEMVLEGGALVLADGGICCIDEFDKMEDGDRTAIHEVMEQQTVSIAKGGITTTLNARTAVLAAANPAFGRYNRNRSPSENIDMPAALLSRFDIMFLLVDEADEDNDLAIARHIGYVHQHGTHPPLSFESLDGNFLRSYVAQARRYQPKIPTELCDYICQQYVSMRAEDVGADPRDSFGDEGSGGGSGPGRNDKTRTYTTARTLLSILRLAQGLARLRFDDEVIQEDVDEAIRLMESSTRTLVETSVRRKMDPVSAVYSIITQHMRRRELNEVKVADIKPLVLAKGYAEDVFENALKEYEEINVWYVRGTGIRKLVLVSE